ncbi:MAG: class II aldolase, partial [Gammaproteobacteria bacterium]|nr:class II aldolase [Gammaproteobacteria bacterium]
PSIETPLHALLPHKVVVHVHSVEVLARVVLHGARETLGTLLAGIHWAWVDYAKPGPDLAQAVVASVAKDKAPDVLVLANHGLVVGGESVADVNETMRSVIGRLRVQPRPFQVINTDNLSSLVAEWASHGFRLPIDTSLHRLAQDRHCLKLAQERWVLYPDHVVFLGEIVPIADSIEAPDVFLARFGGCPPCVIVSGKAVLVREGINPAQEAMIGCYTEVTSRLRDPESVLPLSRGQIADLVNWEAEKYRQKLAR